MLSPYVPTDPGNVVQFPHKPPPPQPPFGRRQPDEDPESDWPWWMGLLCLFCLLYAAFWVLLIKWFMTP